MTEHLAHRDGSFAHLRLGRLPVKHDDRTLELARYLDVSALPPIPADHDLTASVRTWPMYGNDELGDCTCAAAGHMIQAWTGAAGKVKTPLALSVERMYWETGNPPADHGAAGSAADEGRVELDVLNYWRNHGLAGDKITAYVSVDPGNLDHVRAAIYLFGGVYTGVALPLSAQTQHVWDIAGDGKTGASRPGSWGGHAVPLLAYTPTDFACVTWGGVLRLTDRFWEAYGQECYAIIDHDFLRAGKSPAGFDLKQLTTDLHAL